MAERIRLTLKRISDLPHPATGKTFLWDTDSPTLAVLASPKKKNYIFESRLNGQTIRITIGDVRTFTLEGARIESNRLKSAVNQGIDPREQKRQVIAEQEEARAARVREDSEKTVKAMLVADAWAAYLEERRPHWGELHYQDHIRLSQTGGCAAKIGNRIKKPGPLAPLMHISLADLTTTRLETWLKYEVEDRPTQTRLALRLLKAFLNWCSVHDRFKLAAGAEMITRKTTANMPKKQANTDGLQKEQLAAWFTAVRQIDNPVIAAYLQGLLLTGARRRELSGLQWEDIDFRWKSISIRDKVEGVRVIPLTPFLESLLRFLPRRNDWVFSSPSSATGRLMEPTRAHQRAVTVAGIPHVSLHGLRRSFGSLSEWCELPVGIVAQIMGHKPSATAEKHYRVRPLDLLRMWHIKFESWILGQAGIVAPDRQEEAGPLKLVATGK